MIHKKKEYIRRDEIDIRKSTLGYKTGYTNKLILVLHIYFLGCTTKIMKSVQIKS